MFISKFFFKFLSLVLFLLSFKVFSDSFTFNSYNNHGITGLLNVPSARTLNESSHGVTIYDGYPDQKITLTSNPYDWLEASFFYTNIQDKPYPGFEYQDYKDKGFNFKVKIKDEGRLPAIAIGINDIAGTGYYSSEYIVGSYGINNIDFHFGLAWGTLNGAKSKIKNPFGYLNDSFYERPSNTASQGGQFQPSRYFSGQNVSPFLGMSYVLNEKLHLKFEKDTTNTKGLIEYKESSSEYTFGIDYHFNKNFMLGIAKERGNQITLRFIYRDNPSKSLKKYKYKKSEEIQEEDNKYTKLIKNIEANGIGVNKILETSNSIGLELTQFMHPSLDIVEEIITSAKFDAGISKDVKTDYRIADLKASSDFDENFEKEANIVFQRKKERSFSTKNRLTFRPFIASREEFFKGALLVENNSEYLFRDNLFFSSNLKYSIWDNFDDLTIPPENTFPEQVRSDIKDYLRNFDNGIIIGRAQFDYHYTPKNNHHLMFSAGILEEMYSGYGLEYLYFKNNRNYAVGFEIFEVRKRDYEMRFGLKDYQNITGSLNFYYRNYDLIPFDMEVSYGEYLAGDEGITFEISRSFINGTKFGIFATFTDVSSEEFGEGSFDKGIFFNIPVYGNFINYTWRPLTKDPGAKLIRRHTLHDLLVKFRPIN